VTCQAPGCTEHAHRPVYSEWRAGEWWMCRHHFRLYRDHNRIVRRILRITPRP